MPATTYLKALMREISEKQAVMHSLISPETRVPKDHPLRSIKGMAGQELGRLYHTKRPIDMLISTKLNIPLLKERIISREHLIDQLSAGKDRRLILITGMAGSSKTCLVCQWIEHDKISAAWYSLDPTDNEEDLFFRYLLTSFAKKDDRLAETFKPFLQATRWE
jgi:hypothetical protein